MRLWHGLMTLGEPLVRALLAHRAKAGKEDPDRVGERLGHAVAPRPPGPLIWLHGASVGESLVAWNVAQDLLDHQPALSILITSGTRTSADMLARKIDAAQARRVIHQYVPVDLPQAAEAFLTHWRPDLGVFVEGEIWPNLLTAARARNIPTALINARMTLRSLTNWRRVPDTACALFGGFDFLHAADEMTATGLAALACLPHVLVPSNLKLAAKAPQVEADALEALKSQIGGRPVWLAASTHEGEEKPLVAAHGLLQLALPDALLILAPRHPERAADVRVTCTLAGASHASRSSGDVVAPDTDVLIWDTLGELPLACAACPVTVLAGSLVAGIGGHNPVEPLQMGSAVITGPFGFNFANTFASLADAGAIRVLETVSSDTIALAVSSMMGDEDQRLAGVAAGQAVIAEGAKGAGRITTELLNLLERSHH